MMGMIRRDRRASALAAMPAAIWPYRSRIRAASTGSSRDPGAGVRGSLLILPPVPDSHGRFVVAMPVAIGAIIALTAIHR